MPAGEARRFDTGAKDERGVDAVEASVPHRVARFDSRSWFARVARGWRRFCNRAILDGSAPLRVKPREHCAFVAQAWRAHSDETLLELSGEGLTRWPFTSIQLSSSGDLEGTRCRGDLAQDLLARLVLGVRDARGQVIVDSHEHGVELHDCILIDSNVFGNGDGLPLGLLVLSIHHVHCRTAPRPDVVEGEGAIHQIWRLGKRAEHVGVVDVLDDVAV